jgi:membrane fusion protein (multidrug efflux system)
MSQTITFQPPAPTQASARLVIKRGLIGLAVLAALTGAADFGRDYWTTGRFLESTDDATIQADYTTISPKVSGYIANILVRDNQPVQAGQLLARIDDRDFRTALAQAQADVAAADAALRNFDAQITLQQSDIVQANATISATAASLAFAEQEATRYRDLMQTGFGTVQRAQQTEAARAQAAAQLRRDEAARRAAQEKIAVLVTARDQAAAQRDHAVAVAQQAEQNLSYTAITAPLDGTVGARSLRVGQYVTAGTDLMAIVPLNAAYVVGNFKETQLAHVHAGQPVTITVDGAPGVRLKAHVDSLAPASGLEFALLPPDNATGNFTKIVQRIPVRIALDDQDPAVPLRAGMSVEPTIDTRPDATAERTARRQPTTAIAGERG